MKTTAMGSITERLPPLGLLVSAFIILIIALSPFAKSPKGLAFAMDFFVLVGIVGMVLTLWLLFLGK